MASTKQDRDFTAIRAIFPARSEPLSLDAIAAALARTASARPLML